jgi:hypothetical protein
MQNPSTFHLSKTSNQKLGKGVYASTSSSDTCPITCGMYKECYAKKGPQSWHWNKVSRGQRGTDWLSFCADVEKLKPGTLFRHNVSGDLPYVARYPGDTWRCIDTVALDQLQCSVVNSGVKFYTYTHTHTDTVYSKTNLDTIKRFSQPGFVINLSTEKPRDAFKFKQLGFDVVITNTNVFDLAVNSIKTHRKPATIVVNGDSVPVVPCPEQYTESATCATCKLCARANRKYVIAFKKH